MNKENSKPSRPANLQDFYKELEDNRRNTDSLPTLSSDSLENTALGDSPNSLSGGLTHDQAEASQATIDLNLMSFIAAELKRFPFGKTKIYSTMIISAVPSVIFTICSLVISLCSFLASVFDFNLIIATQIERSMRIAVGDIYSAMIWPWSFFCVLISILAYRNHVITHGRTFWAKAYEVMIFIIILCMLFFLYNLFTYPIYLIHLLSMN